MGQEDDAAARAKTFAPFQVNEELVRPPDSVVLHCLPAPRRDYRRDRRPPSVVFDEAENRPRPEGAASVAGEREGG